MKKIVKNTVERGVKSLIFAAVASASPSDSSAKRRSFSSSLIDIDILIALAVRALPLSLFGHIVNSDFQSRVDYG